MSKPLAAFLVAFISALIVVPVSEAAPAEVSVRIEGKTETIFEGPVLTDGHAVKGLTDTEAPASGRPCDGLNNGANPTPGPTPTAAAVDAMAILGEGFDGDWYESFDDYFISQWGPERQDLTEGEYWGLAVNNVFSSVGGCQYRVDSGDEVLWIYDAFDGRPQLVLYPGDYSGGSVQLTAEASLGVPFEVTVEEWSGDCCTSSPPPWPTRSTNSYEGAEVAPVVTTARGFERVDPASTETVETGPGGSATVTFDTPGWHRIKATATAAGKETAIRSNRLDVCVPDPPASNCGPLPADDLARTPPVDEDPNHPGPSEVAGEVNSGPVSRPPAPSGRIRVALRRLDKSRLAAGVVAVSWRVRETGPGIAKWRVSSRTLGRSGVRFLTRASGRTKSSARVRLPPDARYALRLTFTDLLGRSSSFGLGTVRVPG